MVYDNLLHDLNLKPKAVPLLAGVVVNVDQGGACASMNKIIATLPNAIPNASVISSASCPQKGDKLHFTAAGYRELGKRYRIKNAFVTGILMLSKHHDVVQKAAALIFLTAADLANGN